MPAAEPLGIPKFGAQVQLKKRKQFGKRVCWESSGTREEEEKTAQLNEEQAAAAGTKEEAEAAAASAEEKLGYHVELFLLYLRK